MSERIGIFGGSFDPVHLGHKRLADFAVNALKLDRLLIIPTACSPFKTRTFSPDEHRMNMCRLQFCEDKFEVSDIEIMRGGKSYTVDTVNAVKELYPDSTLFLIIGSDQLRQFHKWYCFDKIMEKAVICAVARAEKDDISAMEKYSDENLRQHGECKILEFTPLEISSTDIRQLIKNGENTDCVLSREVSQYAKREGLYL